MKTGKGKLILIIQLADLINYFCKFGNIYKIIIPFDSTKQSNEFKGYALVTFESSEDVEKVISMNNHIILNRKVFIFKQNKNLLKT